MATIGNSNRGLVFPVWSMTRCYKQDSENQLRVDSWSNELVGRQSPDTKNVSMEAEDTVGIRYRVTTGENIAN
jgi:hypothetical protein